GLTIPRENVPDFRARFAKLAGERITEENRRPRLRIDVEIDVAEIDLELADALDSLGPFGFGNPRPRVLLKGARSASKPRVVGRGHLKLGLRRNGAPSLDCIGFDLGDLLDRVDDSPLDVVGNVSVNQWNGRRSAQLQILDLRAA
ncbi:MAG: single-stranded-DNA-specific exonuclease RecJ, partial [Gemmatimonadetes bacterium]|nr:single-stranded-DNA-specific exonuclease RecJ [Gemmatimonadota bacterium]